MSYQHRVCDPMNGGDNHDWKVTVCDWIPAPRKATFEDHVIQGCKPCGKLRAVMWTASGRRLPYLYSWARGRKPDEATRHRFTREEHRDRLLKRAAELAAEQRNARQKPPAKQPRRVQSARKAA